jgi:hypothetical protein
MDLRTFVKK